MNTIVSVPIPPPLLPTELIASKTYKQIPITAQVRDILLMRQPISAKRPESSNDQTSTP